MNQCTILRGARWATLFVTAALLAACGTSKLSQITDDGHLQADAEPVWPSIKDNNWQAEGTFPGVDNLRRIAPGLSKNQVYELLGRPHFAEGQVAVREWDYVFNFYTGKDREYTMCQYKILFDKNKKTQDVFWLPANCSEQLKGADTLSGARIAR